MLAYFQTIYTAISKINSPQAFHAITRKTVKRTVVYIVFEKTFLVDFRVTGSASITDTYVTEAVTQLRRKTWQNRNRSIIEKENILASTKKSCLPRMIPVGKTFFTRNFHLSLLEHVKGVNWSLNAKLFLNVKLKKNVSIIRYSVISKCDTCILKITR